ncbi:unnamed protein product [Prorocentrum cordatum]|uniref:Helicase ATP-binding domain-containing protein n=1 Tax=Prorocentrum cordatum TaxID=2364126 RepID=A0ABN9VPX6_9DINO|nr:unnamed protein product [Polarella glacialis]
MGPQLEVIERALRACESRSVALLESPTGTGKSIALLTAALAYQRRCFASRGAAPQIVYGVRTHAQLAQMVRELRKMPYRPRMAVIGSRDQLCTNLDVRAAAQRQRLPLNLACRQAARATFASPGLQRRGGPLEECACTQYARLGDAAHARRVHQQCGRQGALWDVEDLVKASQGTVDGGGCPYYTAHVLAGNAEIIFCPHNYVMDPAVSKCKSHHRERWSLKDRVVIMDEAHNLEQGCREAGSVKVSFVELRQLARPRRVAPRGAAPAPEGELRGPRALLPRGVCRAAAPAAVPPRPPRGAGRPWRRLGRGGGAARGPEPRVGPPGAPASCLLRPSDFLATAGLAEWGVLGRAVEELGVELADRLLRAQGQGEGEGEDAALLGALGRLLELQAKLGLAAQHHGSYVVGIGSEPGGRSFAAWLMSPGVISGDPSEAHAVLLASGTLAPLRALSAELAASAAFRGRALPEGPLQAPHVIGRAQLLVSVLPRFLGSGRPAMSTFENWRRESYLADMGSTIASLAEEIPAGVLCFFPSYAVIEACVCAWRSSACGIWARLERCKGAVVVEPRGSDQLAAVRAAYTAAARSPRGALCLSVYRGKMSEGLSFDDDLCRGIVCAGVPYPQSTDPLVIAKRRWNDARRQLGDTAGLSGEEWYSLQAYRAVNQAVGRCIRHRADYGAVVLLDARWAGRGEHARGLRRHLAGWLQPFVEEPSPAASPGAGLGARLRGAAGDWALARGPEVQVAGGAAFRAAFQPHARGTRLGQALRAAEAPGGRCKRPRTGEEQQHRPLLPVLGGATQSTLGGATPSQ